MIAHRHKETGTFFADIHAALDFTVDIVAAAHQQNTRICVADKGMCFPVFFRDIGHIGRGFQNESMETTFGNIVDKCGVGSVGGEDNLFARLEQRLEILFIIGENIPAISRVDAGRDLPSIQYRRAA